MSVLETPRILFQGNMSWDPITTNNFSQLYDEDAPGTIYPPDSTIQEKVAAFRKEAIADVNPDLPNLPRRSWNPHGTHRCSFFDETVPDAAAPDSSIVDSCVSGFDLGEGVDCEDPFVGVPARFTGMLVDVEPYGGTSSQLFFDSMSFGIDGGCRIAAKRRFRVAARYANIGRNPVFYIAGLASIIWQTSFAKQDLVVDAYDSKALQALLKAMEDDDVYGLTVRWNTYRTVYYDTPGLATDAALRTAKAQALMAKLNGGGFQPNPARSKMVGVIGLCRRGEPISEPGDRALLATANQDNGPPFVATAFARLADGRLTVDLGNSMPETGLDLTKQDLGDLEVVAVDPTSQQVVATLGALAYRDYDREAYEAGSGLVTLKVDSGDAAKAESANLQLRQADGTILLDEAPLRCITRFSNMYLDTNVAMPAFWQVYERGAPAGAGIALTFYALDPNGNVLGKFDRTTSAGGATGFALHFTTGTVVAYVPVFATDPPPAQGLNSLTNTYLNVRVLPSDPDIARLPPTWDNVYTHVLANWNAMAPCMDNWLDLADEDRVRAYAPVIKRLTDPLAFESFAFMPVTRDMTHGQRALLYNFLHGIEPAPAFEAPARLKAAVAPAEKTLTEASRAMRSG